MGYQSIGYYPNTSFGDRRRIDDAVRIVGEVCDNKIFDGTGTCTPKR
jgi:hypothetical protein